MTQTHQLLHALYNGPMTLSELIDKLFEDNSYKPLFNRGQMSELPRSTELGSINYFVNGPFLYFKSNINKELTEYQKNGYVERMIVARRISSIKLEVKSWPFGKIVYRLSDKGKMVLQGQIIQNTCK